MGTSHAREFWSGTERHHDLAQSYEEGIELTHPDFVTERFGPYRVRSKWMATKYPRPTYRGPSVKP